MSIIVMIPALWAAFVASTDSIQKAFLNFYVPMLLMMPNYYYWVAPGIPDPNFHQAIATALIAIWITRGIPGWRFSFTDVLVTIFACSVALSEYTNVGYKDAQNLAFDMLASVIFPYILGKSLISPNGLDVAFAKRVVICLYVVTILCLHQFFSGDYYTLWQRLLGRFFPGQGWGWPTSYRWGFVRVSGPYGHAILAGIVMIVGYRIQRWLEWSHAWSRREPYLNWSPFSPARLLTLGVLVGALITLVRGPLLGGAVAALIAIIGRFKKRWLIFSLIGMHVIVISMLVTPWFIEYASAGRSNLEYGSAQETVAYRWELMINYIEVANERFWLGWGRNTWPKDPRQPSVDNAYLLLFLQHGMMGLGTLFVITFSMMIRLFLRAMLEPIADPPGSSLSFTLLSIYVVFVWSLATVYFGEQTVPFFYLLLGWSEGHLQTRQGVSQAVVVTHQIPSLFQFRRVLN